VGRRENHLSTALAHHLRGGKLVLPVDAGGASLDHLLLQLEGVDRPPESCLGIGDDRREPVGHALVVGRCRDLVGTKQRVVDPTHQCWDRVGRVEALIGIGLRGEVAVRRNLPTGDIDHLDTGLNLLHGLQAGQGAERVDAFGAVEQLPQELRSAPSERRLLYHRALQPHDVLRAVRTVHACPTPVAAPILCDPSGPGCLVVGVRHPVFSFIC